MLSILHALLGFVSLLIGFQGWNLYLVQWPPFLLGGFHLLLAQHLQSRSQNVGMVYIATLLVGCLWPWFATGLRTPPMGSPGFYGAFAIDYTIILAAFWVVVQVATGAMLLRGTAYAKPARYPQLDRRWVLLVSTLLTTALAVDVATVLDALQAHRRDRSEQKRLGEMITAAAKNGAHELEKACLKGDDDRISEVRGEFVALRIECAPIGNCVLIDQYFLPGLAHKNAKVRMETASLYLTYLRSPNKTYLDSDKVRDALSDRLHDARENDEVRVLVLLVLCEEGNGSGMGWHLDRMLASPDNYRFAKPILGKILTEQNYVGLSSENLAKIQKFVGSH